MCYRESSAIPSREFVGKKQVRFPKGVTADFKNYGEKPCQKFLNDLLNETHSKDICDLFTKDSHHRNISVIVITQNLFNRGRYSRGISLNANYIVIFKTVRDKNQLSNLA